MDGGGVGGRQGAARLAHPSALAQAAQQQPGRPSYPAGTHATASQLPFPSKQKKRSQTLEFIKSMKSRTRRVTEGSCRRHGVAVGCVRQLARQGWVQAKPAATAPAARGRRLARPRQHCKGAASSRRLPTATPSNAPHSPSKAPPPRARLVAGAGGEEDALVEQRLVPPVFRLHAVDQLVQQVRGGLRGPAQQPETRPRAARLRSGRLRRGATAPPQLRPTPGGVGCPQGAPTATADPPLQRAPREPAAPTRLLRTGCRRGRC